MIPLLFFRSGYRYACFAISFAARKVFDSSELIRNFLRVLVTTVDVLQVKSRIPRFRVISLVKHRPISPGGHFKRSLLKKEIYRSFHCSFKLAPKYN